MKLLVDVATMPMRVWIWYMFDSFDVKKSRGETETPSHIYVCPDSGLFHREYENNITIWNQRFKE